MKGMIPMSTGNFNIWWKIKHSLWMLLTLLPLLNFLAFVYIGWRSKTKKWVVYGILYAVPSVFLIIGLNSTLEEIYLILVVLTWFVSVIHAIIVRNTYLYRLRGGDERAINQIIQQYGASLDQVRSEINRATIRE